MAGPGFRARPRWPALAREITIVLVVKVIALCLLWIAFFSNPARRHLDAGGVAQSLVAPPAHNAQPRNADHAARPASR